MTCCRLTGILVLQKDHLPDQWLPDRNQQLQNDTEPRLHDALHGGDDTWMSFEVPLIKPLSKESYIKTLDGIYNDVVEKIESTNFKLPDGVEPLNLV